MDSESLGIRAKSRFGVLKLDITQQQPTAFYERLQLEFCTFNIRSRASRIVLFFAGVRELYDTSEFLRNFTPSRKGCALCGWTSERKATKDTHRGREWKKVEAFRTDIGEYRPVSPFSPLFAPPCLCQTVISTSFTYCRSLRALSAGLYDRHILCLNLRFALPGSFN